MTLSGVDVTFRLAGGGSYRAVNGATLTVADGEFVAIVGPTGCGKSTLLNVTAGLIAPAAGSVDIFGAPLVVAQPPGRLPVSGRCAVSLEDRAGQRRHRSGNRRHARRQRRARARSNGWSRVGLGAFGDRYPHMLSGGQRKRVGLAQVLIRDPKILLMDEPFGPLDAQTRQIMGNLLLDLWSADRKAVLFVTHDLEEAIALSDRVVIMSAGPAARIIGDWRVPLARPRDISEVKLDPGVPRSAPRHLAHAQGRGDQGIRAGGEGGTMTRLTLLALQILVAVIAIALWYVLTTYPIFGKVWLPPFFFSNPVDVEARSSPGLLPA